MPSRVRQLLWLLALLQLTSPALGQSCLSHYDVYFVLDTTGSMYDNYKPDMIPFVDKLIDALGSNPKTTFSFITFSERAVLRCHHGDQKLKADAQKCVDKELSRIRPNGGTFIGSGITAANNLRQPRAARAATGNKDPLGSPIFIVMTDGEDDFDQFFHMSEPTSAEAAQKARNELGVKLVVVGIGLLDRNGLVAIAGSSDGVYTVSQFSQLTSSFTTQIANGVCQSEITSAKLDQSCINVGYTDQHVVTVTGKWAPELNPTKCLFSRLYATDSTSAPSASGAGEIKCPLPPGLSAGAWVLSIQFANSKTSSTPKIRSPFNVHISSTCSDNACAGAYDIYFILDITGSIGSRYRKNMLPFLNEVVGTLGGNQRSRFFFSTFSTYGEQQCKTLFGTFANDQAQALSCIDGDLASIRPHGATCIGSGFRTMNVVLASEMASPTHGSPIYILVTDGKDTNAVKCGTELAVNKAKQLGATIITIGAGHVDEKVLRKYATTSSYALTFDDMDKLDKAVAQTISSKLCTVELTDIVSDPLGLCGQPIDETKGFKVKITGKGLDHFKTSSQSYCRFSQIGAYQTLVHKSQPITVISDTEAFCAVPAGANGLTTGTWDFDLMVDGVTAKRAASELYVDPVCSAPPAKCEADYDTYLVVDHTGSMGSDYKASVMPAVKRLVELLASSSAARTAFFVTAFAETAENLCSAGPVDKDAALNCIGTELANQVINGQTWIGGGIQEATKMLTARMASKTHGSPLMIIITDGEENMKTKPDCVTAADAVKALKVPVFVIAVGPECATIDATAQQRAIVSAPDNLIQIADFGQLLNKVVTIIDKICDVEVIKTKFAGAYCEGKIPSTASMVITGRGLQQATTDKWFCRFTQGTKSETSSPVDVQSDDAASCPVPQLGKGKWAVELVMDSVTAKKSPTGAYVSSDCAQVSGAENPSIYAGNSDPMRMAVYGAGLDALTENGGVASCVFKPSASSNVEISVPALIEQNGKKASCSVDGTQLTTPGKWSMELRSTNGVSVPSSTVTVYPAKGDANTPTTPTNPTNPSDPSNPTNPPSPTNPSNPSNPSATGSPGAFDPFAPDRVVTGGQSSQGGGSNGGGEGGSASPGTLVAIICGLLLLVSALLAYICFLSPKARARRTLARKSAATDGAPSSHYHSKHPAPPSDLTALEMTAPPSPSRRAHSHRAMRH